MTFKNQDKKINNFQSGCLFSWPGLKSHYHLHKALTPWDSQTLTAYFSSQPWNSFVAATEKLCGPGFNFFVSKIGCICCAHPRAGLWMHQPWDDLGWQKSPTSPPLGNRTSQSSLEQAGGRAAAQAEQQPGKRPGETGHRAWGGAVCTDWRPVWPPWGFPASTELEHPTSHKSGPVPDKLNEAELLSKEGTHWKACLIALKLVLRNHRQ